jgi:eukaryotic-like serine/threonine-protein kinase
MLAVQASGGVTVATVAPALAYVDNEDLPAGSLAGEYQIEKKIGEGGMGSVYGARHPLIGKRAAIKVIRRELSGSREAVDRFVLEAQSVNQIGHPNIVDVFGFGQLPDGRSFFVMEWLEGEPLRERLQRPLQFPEALEILETIAKALEAAHDAGVVHRDLKPDNVYLQSRKGDKPTVKLLDFGLAKLTNQGDGQGLHQTRTGVVMGTPLYLSPEQAKGQKIDAATDVYSLGAMAYEMLSGVVPFKADSAVEIMAMHISQRAQPLLELAPWVPPEIDALVLQMLDKEPRNRPTTEQVRERLAACRMRASQGTLGMQIQPSSQPPPYTPQVPMGAMHAPTPGMYAPPVGSGSHPPSYGGVGASGVAQPARKRMLVIIASAVVAAVAVGGVVFTVLGKRKDRSAQTAANDTLAGNSVADPGPAARDPVTPDPTPPEPARTPKVEPAGDAAKDEPAGSDPAPDLAPVPDPDPAPPDVKKPDKAVARPAPPRRGKLIVTFDGPSRATVLVDGKRHGGDVAGRVTLELAPGDHTVRVQAKGYKPADARVRVEPGGSRDVKLTLEKRKNVNAVHDPFAD